MEEELRRLLEDMPEVLEEFKRTGSLSAESLEKVRKNAAAAADAQSENTDAVKEATRRLRRFYEQTIITARGYTDTAGSLRQNREEFAGLNPAINATGTVLTALAGATGGLIDILGNSALIAGIIGLNPALIGVGAGVKIFGQSIGKLGEEGARAAVALGEFATREIDRQVGAFRTLTSAGVVTAEGFAGLRRRAESAGLSFEQLSQVVSKTSSGLVFFSGDAATGADAFASLSAQSEGTRRQLLNLGIGFVEQNELLAESLSFNRRIGRNQITDQRTLAQAAQDYVVQLVALTRLTGASREEVKRSIDRAREEARSRGAIELATRNATKSVATNIENVFAVLENKFGPEMATAFANSLQGVPVGELAQEFTFLTNSALPQLALALNEGQITAGEFIERLYDASQANADTVAGLAAFNAGVGAFGEANYTNFLDFVNSGRISAESFDAIAKEIDAAKKTQEESTKQIGDAQVAMQNFATGLDGLVADSMPMLTKAINGFVQGMIGPDGFATQLVNWGRSLVAGNAIQVQQGPPRPRDDDRPALDLTPDFQPLPNVPGTPGYNPNLPGTLLFQLPNPQASTSGPRSNYTTAVEQPSFPDRTKEDMSTQVASNSLTTKSIEALLQQQNTLLEAIQTASESNLTVSRDYLRRALA